MKTALWQRVLLLLSVLLFVPAVASVQAQAVKSQSVQLAKKYAEYEQFIMIDKSTNQLYFFEKGKLVKSFTWPRERSLPIRRKACLPFARKSKIGLITKKKSRRDPKNPLGDRWLGLKVTINGKTSYAYGIHGNNNEKSIGKYVSAGCIRMHNKEVRWLYDQVKTSTPVLIVKKLP